MKKSSLPTRKECQAIIKEYHVPPHIVKHSLAAAKLAVFLEPEGGFIVICLCIINIYVHFGLSEIGFVLHKK